MCLFKVNAQDEIREFIIDSAKQGYGKGPVTDCSTLFKNKTIRFDYKSFKIPASFGTAMIVYLVNQEKEEDFTNSRDNKTWSYYKCLNSANQECNIQLVSPPFEGKNLVELYVTDQGKFFVFYMKAKDEEYKNIKSKNGWIFIGESKAGDLHYIRNKCEEKNASYIKVWQKTILKKITIDGKLYYRVQELALEKYDCRTSRFLPASLVRYDSVGNLLQDFDFSKYSDNWTDVVPESMIELKFNFACSKFGK